MKIFDPKLTGSIEILNEITGDVTMSANLLVEGNLSGNITGSASTASYIELSNVDGSASLASRIFDNSSSIASLEAVSGSYANSASFASSISANSASIASLEKVSGSYANSASFASNISANSASIGSLNAVSSSYLLNTTDTLTGDLTVTGNIIATTLNVQDVTASVVYSSGSNVFGSSSIDTQQFTGSILTTGSIEVTGPITSGAIVSSASITAAGNSNSFGNTTIGALSASTGTFSASVTAAGNSNSLGTTTFTGNITLTGGTTSGLNITTSGTQDTIKINRAANNDNAITKYQTASADKWIVGLRNTGDDNFRFYSYGTSSDVLTINQADGNSTFAGMITVNGGGIDIDNDDDVRLRFDNAGTFKAGLQVVTTTGDMIAGSAVNDFAIRSQGNMLFASGGNTERLKLDTSGNATFVGDVTVHNSSAGYSVISGDGNGAIYSSNGDVQFFTNNSAYAINFYAANKGDKLLTIANNGDTMIGNTVVNPASGFASQKGFGYDGGTGQTQIATTDNASTLVLGRNNATDGSIIDLRKESGVIGTFGSNTTGGEPLLDISANATNGNMRFVTAGSEALRIDSSQNVRTYAKLGIRVDGDAISWRGTAQIPAVINLAGNGALFTRPDQTFLSQNFYYDASDIGAVIDAGQGAIVQCNAGEIIFSGTSTGASSNAQISIIERMRVTSGGDITISGGDIFLNSGTNYNDKGVVYLSNERTAIISDIVDGTANGDTSLDFQTRKGGTRASAMFINEFRNVMIGTTTQAPSAQLTIALEDSVGGRLSLSNLRTALFDGDEFGRLSFVSNDTTQTGDRARISAVCKDTGAATDLVFYTGNTSASVADRMRITSGGNIDISNATTGNAGTRIWGGSDGGIIYMYRPANGGTNVLRFYVGTTLVGDISTTNTATTYNSASDYRLKEDLQDFAGLDMVSKIPVYDFKWKSDESRSYGVMAHELQEVLPQAVNGKKDAEEMQSVDYSKIVPLLVKSIQELKSDNDSLKARIETLENN